MTDEEREDLNTFRHDLVKQARWWQWKAETLEKEKEQLKAENAALRERLEKAVELPCIEIKKHTSPKVIYNLIYRNELGNITVYEYPAFMQSVAFAHLAELKGDK